MKANLIQTIVTTVTMMAITQAVVAHVYEALEIADKYNYATHALAVVAQR